MALLTEMSVGRYGGDGRCPGGWLVLGRRTQCLHDPHSSFSYLVPAGNYGTGSRAGGVSTLICAVRDDRRADDEDGADRSDHGFRMSSDRGH